MNRSLLSEDRIKYIVARLLEKANDVAEESRADSSDTFLAGKRLAYYEMLDVLKSELDVSDADLVELGLDIDLESKIA